MKGRDLSFYDMRQSLRSLIGNTCYITFFSVVL